MQIIGYHLRKTKEPYFEITSAGYWTQKAMETEVYEQMAAIENEHWWFIARRKILTTILTRLPLPPNARILEAGCGTGGNLVMLARFGQVAAFEPDARAREYTSEKGNHNVLYGSLPWDIPFPENTFDLVVALDVLEHLEDDETALKALRQHLKTDGWGLFTVPAFPFLWSRHDDRHHHKRRYNKIELVKKITRAGFTIHFASYFNTILFPLIAGIRLIRNRLGIEGPTDDTMPISVLNQILKLIFSSEQYLIKKTSLPVGVSLLMVVSNKNL
jgi:SAM-dependent methyltransferase